MCANIIISERKKHNASFLPNINIAYGEENRVTSSQKQ